MAVLTTAELDRRLAAVELYRAGSSTAAVAERLGIAPSTVSRWLEAYGVARRDVSERQALGWARRRAAHAGMEEITRRAMAARKAGKVCARCEQVLTGSTNANRRVVCDDCDGELRRGVLYADGELPEARRKELGYG